MENTSALFSILIFIFLIIFSAKTQLTSLMERFREIGILKSLGWSNSKLSHQILLISIFQALVGASIGVLFGFLIILLIDSYHIKLFNLIEFQFKYSSISALLILSLIGGLIAAIFPIVKLYHTRAGEMINNFM
jgi:ABC-type antimicrobial peptide transport system permease subunit